MQKNYRRVLLGGLILGTFLVIGVKTSSASTCTPEVTGTKNIKEDSLSLKISCSNLDGEDVDVKVRMENTDSDSVSTKNFEISLDDSGNGDIKISNLDSGTLYNFKLKIKKSSDDAYSDYSNSLDATTKGAKYTPKIDSIKSVKNTSLILKTACSKLKKKKVTFQVRIENKDDDSISTKTYDATLDKSGKYDLKIQSLDSSTEYGFKLKIKSSTDNTYSVFSNEKTAQTKS